MFMRPCRYYHGSRGGVRGSHHGGVYFTSLDAEEVDALIRRRLRGSTPASTEGLRKQLQQMIEEWKVRAGV